MIQIVKIAVLVLLAELAGVGVLTAIVRLLYKLAKN